MSEYGQGPWSQPSSSGPESAPGFHVPDQHPAEPTSPYQAPTYQPTEPTTPYQAPTYQPAEPTGYQPAEPTGYQPGQPYPGYPAQPYQQPYPQPYQASPWPQQSWPAPVAPPAKGRFGFGALVAVAVVTAVVCGAVGAISGYALKDTKRTTTATSTLPSPLPTGLDLPSAAPSTSTNASAGAALLAKIVPAPAGAHKFTLPYGVGGVMDLTANCKEFFGKSTTAAGRLTQEGFVVAAATSYSRTDGLQILTHLTEFATADGATSYVTGQFSSWDADTKVTGTFTFPGGGKGYEKQALDALGNRRTIMYERVGTIVIGLDVFTPGSFNRITDLTVMAAQIAAIG
jgi:hypothetical protein